MSEYIRKADAVEALKAQADTMHTWVSRYDEQRTGILTAVNIVEDIEPADVAPVVHAYWRDTGSGQECSACKEIQYGYDTGRHYCPNCGAKMDGERREE